MIACQAQTLNSSCPASLGLNVPYIHHRCTTAQKKKLRELRTLEVVFLISREEQEQRANNVGNN
jgi:hypothetical protein